MKLFYYLKMSVVVGCFVVLSGYASQEQLKNLSVMLKPKSPMGQWLTHDQRYSVPLLIKHCFSVNSFSLLNLPVSSSCSKQLEEPQSNLGGEKTIAQYMDEGRGLLKSAYNNKKNSIQIVDVINTRFIDFMYAYVNAAGHKNGRDNRHKDHYNNIIGALELFESTKVDDLEKAYDEIEFICSYVLPRMNIARNELGIQARGAVTVMDVSQALGLYKALLDVYKEKNAIGLVESSSGVSKSLACIEDCQVSTHVIKNLNDLKKENDVLKSKLFFYRSLVLAGGLVAAIALIMKAVQWSR